MKLELSSKFHPSVVYFSAGLDAMLLLMIFFLLGTSFILQSGVEVNLPQSSSIMQPKIDAEMIIIPANSISQLYYKGKMMEASRFADVLAEANPVGKAAIVSADAKAPYGSVFEILEILFAKGYVPTLATVNKGE